MGFKSMKSVNPDGSTEVCVGGAGKKVTLPFRRDEGFSLPFLNKIYVLISWLSSSLKNRLNSDLREAPATFYLVPLRFCPGLA